MQISLSAETGIGVGCGCMNHGKYSKPKISDPQEGVEGEFVSLHGGHFVIFVVGAVGSYVLEGSMQMLSVSGRTKAR